MGWSGYVLHTDDLLGLSQSHNHLEGFAGDGLKTENMQSPAVLRIDGQGRMPTLPLNDKVNSNTGSPKRRAIELGGCFHLMAGD